MTRAGGMSRAAIEAFLAEPRNAMVGAIRRDGRPQMTPNWFHWDGSRFYVSTTKRRRKFGNFRRDPRVQLAIDDATGFRTVLVDGTVELRDDHEAVFEQFKAIRAKHGREQDDEAFLAELKRDERVLLIITPDKPIDEWTSWGPGS